MLRAWERGHPARKFEELILSGAEVLFFVAFSNRENAKKHEFHEILESRISRIHRDFTEKFLL